MPDVGELYLDTKSRLSGLVSDLDDATLRTPVPACPGWSVADVVSHLTAVADDALAGRLTGIPTDEETAAQVARFRDRPIAAVLATWDELAPSFASMVTAFEVWPAALDVASHEQDIRGALGCPGGRDTDVVRLGAERLMGLLQLPVPLVVEIEEERFDIGGTGPAPQPLLLNTSRFEAFRFMLGRRSRRQLAGLDWSGDPSPVLGHLTLFGPSPEDIVE